jgi:O-antigen ligase
VGRARRDPRAAQRAALGDSPPRGLRLRAAGIGALSIAALGAAGALLTFPAGASTLSLAATGALALLGLAAGFAKPETAAVFLVGLSPLLPALPRFLADPKPGPALLPVAVAALGAAAARRIANREPSPLPRPLLRWAGAFLAVAWASAVSSSLRGETLFLLSRGGAKPLYLNDLMMTAADRTRDAGRIFLALALLLLALDAFARVAERAHGARRLLTALAAGMLAAFLLTAVESRLPVALTVPPWTYIARRAGTFTDPNALGVAAALAAPLLVAAVLDATRWSARRVTALAALLLAPVAIELSGSRSALLLLAVSAALGAAGLWRQRHGLRAAIVGAAVLVVAGAVALTFILPRGGAIARGGLATRLGAVLSSSSLDDVSSHRPLFWRTAFDTVEDEPLTGCGLGGFPYEFPARYAKRHSAVHVTDNATNALLDTAAECGLPGLVLALAAVVPLLVRALDAALGIGSPETLHRLDAPARAGGAALAGFAVACLTGSHFLFPEIALLAALAAALVPRAPDAEPAEPVVSRRVPAILAAAGILASILVVAPTRRADAAFRTGPWTGVWEWEIYDKRAQRWMGPRAFRRIEPGEQSFFLALTNLRPDRRPVLVTADVDGGRVQRLSVPPGETRNLTVDAIPKGAEALRLRFEPTFVPYRLTGGRDFRELSIVLSWDSGEPH